MALIHYLSGLFKVFYNQNKLSGKFTVGLNEKSTYTNFQYATRQNDLNVLFKWINRSKFFNQNKLLNQKSSQWVLLKKSKFNIN